MFFRHCWFYLLGLLPAHGQFPRYVRLVLGYYDCKLELAAWHRAELERLDDTFRLQQAGLKLVIAREKALAKGIGPLDKRYPGIFDFCPDPLLHDFDRAAQELREMKEARLAKQGIFLKK